MVAMVIAISLQAVVGVVLDLTLSTVIAARRAVGIVVGVAAI